MADQTRIYTANSLIHAVAERSDRAVAAILALIEARQTRYNAERIAEYINEAEHQDGDGYWDQFPTHADLLEDYDLYIDALRDTGLGGDAGYCADS